MTINVGLSGQTEGKEKFVPNNRDMAVSPISTGKCCSKTQKLVNIQSGIGMFGCARERVSRHKSRAPLGLRLTSFQR